MSPILTSLPSGIQELLQYDQWMVWRSENGTKAPRRVSDGQIADRTNPANWSTFAEALAACERSPGLGLGFVLSERDPFAVLDLDPTDDPAILAEQKRLYALADDTYSEKSPSGKGCHVWMRATVPTVKAAKIELYSSQFMTITGNVLIDAPIAERQTFAEQVVAMYGGAKESPAMPPMPDQIEVLTLDEIWTRCVQASNGDRFKELWEGRWLGVYPSHSEADLALCNLLAFYTDNRKQVAELWKRSPLGQAQPKHTRNKWVMDMVNKSFDQKIPLIDPILAAHETEKLRKQIQVQKETDAETQYQDWAVPPGLVGRIAVFIYNAAPSPLKEVALAGAIAYYASIVGRAYGVSGMALNQYIVVLAKSGQGKEAAKSGISKINKLLNEMIGENIRMNDRVGPEMIASAQGLLGRLSKTPCMMSILGEFGKTLQAISHKHANQNDINKLSAFLKLYNTDYIGTNAYADSDKNGQHINRPAFSFLGESTPSEFYKAVDEESMKDGFLPRLTLIEYNGDSPEPNEKHEFTQPDPDMLLMLQSQVRQVVSDETLRKVTAVKVSPEADVFQKDLRARCRKLVDEHNRNNEEHITEIWTRVHAKTIKLAGLIAVGVDFVNPVISLLDIQWAETLVMVGTHKLIDRFRSGDVGVSPVESKHYGILEGVLKTYIESAWTDKSEHNWSISESAKRCGVVHSTYISKRLNKIKEFRHARDTGFAVTNIVKHFVNEGRLIEIDKNDGVMRQTSRGGLRAGAMYRINNV